MNPEITITLSKQLQQHFIDYIDICTSLDIIPNINKFLNYEVNWAHLADTTDYVPSSNLQQ